MPEDTTVSDSELPPEVTEPAETPQPEPEEPPVQATQEESIEEPIAEDTTQDQDSETVDQAEASDPESIDLKDVTVDLTENHPKPERADNIVEPMGPFKLTITNDGLYAYLELQGEIPETFNMFDLKF